MSRLEHVNATVADAQATAAMLTDLFGWHVRWQGQSSSGENDAVHVGNDRSYIALFSPADGSKPQAASGAYSRAGLNHLGVVVDDFEAVRRKVLDRGYQATEIQDYEPGRRFYFFEENGIEIEVVSYSDA